MYCIYCHKLCDYRPSHVCEICERKVRINNTSVAIKALLKEAYQYVPSIRLREKIEKVINVIK